MSDVEAIVAAPVTKSFTDAKGETVAVTFAVLKCNMLGEFKRVAEQAFNEARDAEIKRRTDAVLAAADGLAPYDRMRMILQIHDQAPKFELGAEVFTLEGSLKLLTMSARVNQPDMTEAKLAALLPFTHTTVQNLVLELIPAGLVSVEEQRMEFVLRARRKVELMLDSQDHGADWTRDMEAILESLYEVTGEPVPEKYGGPANPPVRDPSS